MRNPIDAFILARLEERGLPHAPEADRATLLRRLSFDLTGLPPTPDELDAFLADRSPLAYERLVDRLLASPHYGERWGQHWLDLARFAETDGFEFDQARPTPGAIATGSSQALNRDLPYDTFVRLQLAGDEVRPGDPAAFIATGFNRCYPDMVDLNDQGLRRQNALNDITETTGLVFLGLTIGCARCHDHKFDPIRQTDFYALQAFFTPARFRDDYPLASAGDRREYEEQTRRWEHELATRAGGLDPARGALARPAGAGRSARARTTRRRPLSARRRTERSPREVELVFEALGRDKRISAGSLAGRSRSGHLAARAACCSRRLERLKRAGAPCAAESPRHRRGGPDAPPTYLLRRGEYRRQRPRGRAGVSGGALLRAIPRQCRRRSRRPARPAGARRWPTGCCGPTIRSRPA